MTNDPVSLYIHIPFCVSKCSYCDFFSIPTSCKNNAVSAEYVEALCNEIKTRLSIHDNKELKSSEYKYSQNLWLYSIIPVTCCLFILSG